jgi:hypothetical protein
MLDGVFIKATGNMYKPVQPVTSYKLSHGQWIFTDVHDNPFGK